MEFSYSEISNYCISLQKLCLSWRYAKENLLLEFDLSINPIR